MPVEENNNIKNLKGLIARCESFPSFQRSYKYRKLNSVPNKIGSLNGDNQAVPDRSIEVQIVGTRTRFGTAGKLIETLRGVGYRMRDSPYQLIF